MAAPASPALRQQAAGRYTIFRKIASGGMASVHFGRLVGAEGFSRTVAIKRLHPHLAEEAEFVSTMIDEARLAARIHHPNVVPTLDVVSANGELLLIMEYVRGESLARLVKAEMEKGGRAPIAITSAIVIGALHGLNAAHDATSDQGAALGIVHRDVSPQNILVGVDGVARIIDFGVAKAAGRLQTTRDGVLKGKVAYMAPEQLSGGAMTRAVDVYAMGIVLWEMLTGQPLFQRLDGGAAYLQVMAGAKEAPSLHVAGLPEGLDALVMKALAIDAADRFASAGEMAEALRSLVPPAFPTDVGKWVQATASKALAERGEALAEIESNSGVSTVPLLGSQFGKAADGGEASAPGGALDEGPDPGISQPSSLSVERSAIAPRSLRPKRHAVVGALVLAALVGASGASLLLRGSSSGATPGAAAPQVVASSVAAVTASAPLLPPPPAAPLLAAESVSSSRSASTALPSAPAKAAHSGAPATKARPAPKPTGPIRFAQPD